MFLQVKMFFSMHKQKIFIVFLSIIAIILFITAIVVLSFWKKGTYKTTTFISTNREFSIVLQDNFDMDISSSSDYELLLKSPSNDNIIAVSKTTKNPIYPITDIINSDKSNYTSQFKEPKNITDITSGTLKNLNYYKYSFDSEEYYVEVYWFEINNNYYIFDFAAAKNSSVDLKSNISSILETLEFTKSVLNNSNAITN